MKIAVRIANFSTFQSTAKIRRAITKAAINSRNPYPNILSNIELIYLLYSLKIYLTNPFKESFSNNI